MQVVLGGGGFCPSKQKIVGGILSGGGGGGFCPDTLLHTGVSVAIFFFIIIYIPQCDRRDSHLLNFADIYCIVCLNDQPHSWFHAVSGTPLLSGISPGVLDMKRVGPQMSEDQF